MRKRTGATAEKGPSGRSMRGTESTPAVEKELMKLAQGDLQVSIRDSKVGALRVLAEILLRKEGLLVGPKD